MSRVAARAAVGVGCAVIGVGSFLPWLRSGSVSRDSYRADGVARRVLHVPAWWGPALHVWPFTALALGLVVALLSAGRDRLAATLGAVLGLGCAAVAIATMTLQGSGSVRPAMTGPVTTLIGAALVVLSSTLLLRRTRSSTRSAP